MTEYTTLITTPATANDYAQNAAFFGSLAGDMQQVHYAVRHLKLMLVQTSLRFHREQTPWPDYMQLIGEEDSRFPPTLEFTLEGFTPRNAWGSFTVDCEQIHYALAHLRDGKRIYGPSVARFKTLNEHVEHIRTDLIPLLEYMLEKDPPEFRTTRYSPKATETDIKQVSADALAAAKRLAALPQIGLGLLQDMIRYNALTDPGSAHVLQALQPSATDAGLVQS